MIVRRAVEDDLDVLTPLFDAYRQFYGQASDLERARTFLADRLRLEESVVFLAFEGGRAIGFTQLYPSFTSVGTARTLVLNDLYVAGDNRRGGVGKALIAAAVAYARETGAKGLSLTTGVENVAAQAVYERLGWEREVRFIGYTFDPASGRADLEDVHAADAQLGAVG